MSFWKKLFGASENKKPAKPETEPTQPTAAPQAESHGSDSSSPIGNVSGDADGMISFEKTAFQYYTELREDLFFRVIPNIKRSTPQGFNLIRQARAFTRESLHEVEIPAFQAAFAQLIAALDRDFAIRRWEVEIKNGIAEIDARIDNDDLLHTTMFAITPDGLVLACSRTNVT